MPARVLVTLGTDGITNWVQAPNGRKLSLGTIAPVKFVVELASNARAARQALDGFVRDGEGMLSVDLQGMLDLLTPRRTRWATDAFIPSDLQQMEKSSLDLQWVDLFLSKAEGQVQKLSSEPGDPSELETLNKSVQALCHPEQVSFEGRLTAIEACLEKVPLSEEGVATLRYLVASLQTPKAAVELAESVLAEVRETNARIDSLVEQGKRFSSVKAKTELAKVVNAVAGIATHDVTVPEVREKLNATACRADELHRLFFSKSAALRPGAATQLESALNKLLRKFRGVKVSLDFRTRGKKQEPYITVAMPSRDWFENTLARDLDALGDFNSLVGSYGAEYKLTGQEIIIQ